MIVFLNMLQLNHLIIIVECSITVMVIVHYVCTQFE
jgi:hypothetical protein